MIEHAYIPFSCTQAFESELGQGLAYIAREGATMDVLVVMHILKRSNPYFSAMFARVCNKTLCHEHLEWST